MLKRFHSFRLSLAAKCELLFGGAVALVIAAAVLVPWLRMEQLTVQLNEQTARALIQSAVDNHVTVQQARLAGGSASRPSALPGNSGGNLSLVRIPELTAVAPSAATQPVSDRFQPVHMVRLSDLRNATTAERRTLQRVDREPWADFYAKLYRQDDDYRYRFGRLLFLDKTCAQCHDLPKPGILPKDMDEVPHATFGVASVDMPSQVEPNQLLLNRVFIFTAALVAGSVAIVVFYLIISRLILQPVRVLQETAEKVSEGDLNIRTHIPTQDEFQVLSQTFNRMLENLKEGEDQLRAINKSLDLKLEEMNKTNIALYESNRLKSEFLANVSHELRTPLNSILGFAEILKDSPSISVDAKGSRYIQNILRSGRNLLDLINDLLDLAKIEAGRMEVRSEALSLSDLFEGLSSILKPLLEPKRLTIEDAVAGEVPLIHTDAAKLQQILYNFLSNAIKFSPEGATITLQASRHDAEHVKIVVSDRGPGIAAEKQSLIFEKFRQVDASHTREHGGTGLGLSISRELTQLLGGQIGVNSVAGDGATFWIVLPLKIQSQIHDVRETGRVAPAGTD